MLTTGIVHFIKKSEVSHIEALRVTSQSYFAIRADYEPHLSCGNDHFTIARQVMLLKNNSQSYLGHTEARILKHIFASPPLFQKALSKLTRVF